MASRRLATAIAGAAFVAALALVAVVALT